jgi:hypothetical protein
MRAREVFYILIIASICYSSSGQQAEPPKGQISVSEILRKNLIATGGLEAHQALESLVASGEFHLGIAHNMGDYKFSYKAPSNDMLQITMISHGTTWTGHRGERRIERITGEGPRMINGVSTEIVERDWRSLVQWDFCCDYSRIELIGLGEADKRPAFALRFTPKSGDPFVCFYDRESFLLVRTDQIQRFRRSRNGPDNLYKVESYFRDYRAQGGVKLPRVIAIPRNEGELVFELSKVKPGEVISASVFQ